MSIESEEFTVSLVDPKTHLRGHHEGPPKPEMNQTTQFGERLGVHRTTPLEMRRCKKSHTGEEYI